MTDRRRNLLILLLVGGLLVGSLYAIFSKPTRLGLDLRGGVELVYEAQPTPANPTVTPDAIQRAIDVMRDRIDQLGVAEPEIQQFGERQISVALPGVADVEEAREQVGQVAQLVFYDWETNVIGPSGEPEPTNPEVTGAGAGAGGPGAALTFYEAVQRAADAEGERDDDNTHSGLFFVVDTEERRVLSPQAGDSREEALQEFNEQAERPEDAPLRGDEEVVEVPAGVTIVRAEQASNTRESRDPNDARWYVLRDDPALDGDEIRNPEQQFDPTTNSPIVTFEFTDEGRERWQQVTREIAERGQRSQGLIGTTPQDAAQHFAIVLDDELISVPFIDFVENPSGIDAANGSQIEGGFTIESAQELANFLKTGALPVQLELISNSQVSATLGQQSLDQGLVAGAAGLGLVALFLLVFYRVLGVIAVLALAIYAVYLLALIKLIPVTLTLPGIAGLILTIGVAADANIVIFERVKEEIRSGRSVMAGIAAGYRKGLTAIVDANVVTVLVAFILFVLATSGVQGFALTLGLGTIVSFLTAVLATQAVLGTMGRSRLLARPSALGAGGEGRPIRIDFMGLSKWFFSASGLILAICALGVAGLGVNFGIDFESGTRIQAALEQRTDVDGVREALASVGLADAEVQSISGEQVAGGANAFQVSSESLTPEEIDEAEALLDERFGIVGDPNTQSIGPTFGETVAVNAIIAIIASLLVISVYITLRFQWKYAVPVLIALAHDLLITAGVYALLGLEVTTATVAALLTILGFSLYDTIIVFDRVRENVPRMPRATFSQIVNRSMSEVIVRSLATTLCVSLPILALLLFGGETLQAFATALLIGSISGTYSSVFIAGQVLTHWKEREPAWQRRHDLVASEHGGVVPAYAVAGARAPVDVEPAPRRRARPSVLTPDDPASRQVSRDEFDDMVRDLHVDQPRAQTAVEERPTPAPAPAPRPEGGAVRAPDADPSELFIKDGGEGRDKSRRPRNRKHGRPR